MKKLLLTGLILTSFITVPSFAREYENYKDCTADNGTKFCDGYFAGKKINSGSETTTTTTAVTPVTETQVSEPAKPQIFDRNNYFFIGGNFGLGAVSYKYEQAAEIMPSAFFNLGLEFGGKFKIVDDYGLGLTAAMDFFAPSEVEGSTSYASVSVGYDLYGFYLDNYFDSGDNTSLVLGFGIADMYINTVTEINGSSSSYTDPNSYSTVLVKMGMIYALSEYTDFTLTGKFGSPDSASGLNSLLMLDIGFRLVF